MRKVSLKGVEVTLRVPEDVALRTEIWLAASDSPLRANSAALAACWSSKHKPKVSYKACRYNPLVFGGQVYNWLIEQEIEQGEIIAAGAEAMDLIWESLPREEEVDEAAGFTEETPKAADSPD